MFIFLIVTLTLVMMLSVRRRRINIPAFYINLDRRVDRRQHCSVQMHKNFSNVTRKRAVDGLAETEMLDPKRLSDRVVPYYDISENARWDGSIQATNRTQRMTEGEIGCCLSHLSIWEAQGTGSGPVMIFEDDVVLQPDFVSKAKRFMDRVPNDWDIIYLGYIDTGGLEATDDPEVMRVIFVFGAYAYALSRSGLEKVRSLLPVDRPLDNFLGKLTETGSLVGYAPVRVLADQVQYGGAQSDIPHSAHSLNLPS